MIYIFLFSSWKLFIQRYPFRGSKGDQNPNPIPREMISFGIVDRKKRKYYFEKGTRAVSSLVWLEHEGTSWIRALSRFSIALAIAL